MFEAGVTGFADRCTLRVKRNEKHTLSMVSILHVDTKQHDYTTVAHRTHAKP